MQFVVATADAVTVEFKPPDSDMLEDATEFESVVKTLVFIDLGAGQPGIPGIHGHHGR